LSGPRRAGGRRVFVLVHRGLAQGVFSSWDAAVEYADANQFSLEHLLEFETRPDHPDHIHLMEAERDGQWQFVGMWSRQPPDWQTPPDRLRMDHYHARGDGFELFRRKEFDWEEGLLARVQPMAPDAALKVESGVKKPPAAPAWKPKIAPLRPLRGQPQNPRPATDAAPAPAPAPPPKAPSSPVSPNPPSSLPAGPPAQRRPLRLKSTKPAPKPIPSFQPAPVHAPQTAESSPAVSAGPAEEQSKVSDGITDAPEHTVEAEATVAARRVWPLRLILPVAAIVLCWAGGLYWVLKPAESAQSIVNRVTSLAKARVLIIEPGQVFFQLPIDPIHQQRWVQSLGLDPIPYGRTLEIPNFHALDTWAKPDGFIRPPYAAVEVEEWWDLRLREVSYGFYHRWDDGSFIVLDLGTDTLVGWARASRLPELLN
jgi:hypothetical protein